MEAGVECDVLLAPHDSQCPTFTILGIVFESVFPMVTVLGIVFGSVFPTFTTLTIVLSCVFNLSVATAVTFEIFPQNLLVFVFLVACLVVCGCWVESSSHLDQKQREWDLLRKRDSTQANNNNKLSTATKIDVLAIRLPSHRLASLCEAVSRRPVRRPLACRL